MARIPKPFIIQERSDSKTFILTLTVASGLPRAVYLAWRRRSFTHFPDALAVYRRPNSKTAADRGARALVEYLKKESDPMKLELPISDNLRLGEWLQKFTGFEGNPRSARLTAENKPYSPATLARYKGLYDLYLKDDALMRQRMRDLDQTGVLEFMSRLSEARINVRSRKKDGGYKMAGTRTYEITVKFIRMAFKEYERTHICWINPFKCIGSPAPVKHNARDILGNEEVVKLFSSPDKVFTDKMEKAVASAMYWAGMRRAEIFALMPENLDWKNSLIHIENAWKEFGNSKRRLGDPKWHKKRTIPFPERLKSAIKELWEEQGIHELVFAWKKGYQKRPHISLKECDIPGPQWTGGRMLKWIGRAELDVSNRNIVPHSARHSIATMLEQDDVPIRYIQDFLGHSDYQTVKGYLHSVDGAINRVGERINGKMADNGR